MSVVFRLDCTPSLLGSPGVPLVSVDLPHCIILYLDRAQLISSNACVQPVAAVLGCAALCMRQTLMSRVLHALVDGGLYKMFGRKWTLCAGCRLADSQ